MVIYNLENTDFLFYCLEECRGIEQLHEHHPEGDVFNHSLQVLEWAFRETNDTDLILAAMLHDVGKVVDSLGHEEIALSLLEDCVSPKTIWLIEHHMRIWNYLEGEMKKLSKVQYLANHPWLPELIQLARWDCAGRNPNKIIKYDKNKIIDRLNKAAEKHFK